MGVVRARSGSRLGSYELGERLGTGGMAEVYMATRVGPHGFNKRFAIKLILPQLAQDPRFVQMFCDEARICASLTHPNIVQVNDFGESEGKLFMAMEYVDGVSCAKLLRAVASRGERFPLAAALFITHEVLRALAFAHEARDEHGRALGVVHRDVSPGNVLIGRSGDVKLTDFGIVRSSFIDRRTYPGELKGKMGYMSPEQVVGAELDARSDLFTVGIVLAEMLLCRPLFPGRNELDILSRIFEADLRVLERFGTHLPVELRSALTRALAREPNARFQSAREFADAIRAVARRSGVGLTEADLAPWLLGLGVLTPSRSGTREAISVPLKPTSNELLRGGDPGESGHMPIARRHQPPATEPPPSSGRTLRQRRKPSYHVRTSSGNLVGPFSLPQMLELVAIGRVNADTQVSPDGLGLIAVRQVPPLARLAERPAFDFRRRDDSRLVWRRALDRRTLPALLYRFAQDRESGLLLFKADNAQKRVYFTDGTPTFVSSSDRRELLGARLVQLGIVTRGAVEESLSAAFQHGQERLGEMLVARGLLRPTALLRVLIEQLEQRFVEIGSWTQGSLSFYRGEQSGEDQLRAPLVAPALVTRLVREGYPDAELAQLLGCVKGEPLTLVANARTSEAELGLTRSELYALRSAPSGLSLERLTSKLVAEGFAQPEDTLRAAFVGLSSGLLSAPSWTSLDE